MSLNKSLGGSRNDRIGGVSKPAPRRIIPINKTPVTHGLSHCFSGLSSPNLFYKIMLPLASSDNRAYRVSGIACNIVGREHFSRRCIENRPRQKQFVATARYFLLWKSWAVYPLLLPSHVQGNCSCVICVIASCVTLVTLIRRSCIV